MKPKTLIISGWGPYKDVQTIDFTAFSGRGLFLITGPTGSGKTTIFDAITFALYGQVSGSLRETAQVRSDFAPEGVKTYVEFTFTHKGESYRILRNPSYRRKKQRGEGYTTEREQAVLYLPGGGAVQGNVPVNEALKELLGIDAVQFKQLSMIAQGEFMRLLIAKADERRDIFRDIFHLGRFDRMRQVIQGRERELRTELAGLRSHLLGQVQKLAGEEEGLKAFVQEDTADWAAVSAHIRSMLSEWKEVLRRTGLENERRARKREEAVLDLKEKERRNGLLEELCKAKEEALELSGQQVEIEAARKRVERGRRALDLAGEAAALQEVRMRRKQQEEREQQELEKEAGLLESLQEQQAAYKAVLKEAEREEQRTEEIRLLGEVLSFMKSLEEEKKHLMAMQEEYQRLEEAYQEQKGIYEELDRCYREAAVGLAARYLVEGMPCPVCGSLTHPRKAQVSEEVPDEGALKAAKEKTDALLEALKEETAKTSGQLGKVQEKKEALQEQLQRLSEDTAEGCSGENPICQASVMARLEQKKAASEKYRKESAAIRELYEEAQRKLEELKIVCAEIREELKKSRDLECRREAEFQEACRKAGFEGEEAYKGSRMEETMLRREELRITEYEKKQILLTQRIEALSGETKGAGKSDLTAEKAEIETLELAMKESRKAEMELHARIQRWEQTFLELREGQKRQGGLEETYGNVSDIARAVSGNNRQNMIFEDYVIAGYFDRILRAANVRLLKLTGGRYELSRVTQALDLRSRDSLEVQVLDSHTGKYRAVKTLSGGEAFKAALSLALGMADIIQQSAGGVEIEALFIDEGFGSLDSESLDQAVETLISLAGPGRLIGIISHVNELKERMEDQVLVEKRADGSRIRIGG